MKPIFFKLMLFFLLSSATCISNASTLTISINIYKNSSLKKENIIGSGTVKNLTNTPLPVIVWSGDEMIPGEHTTYISRGVNNKRNMFKYRLSGKSWSFNKKYNGMHSIIRDSADFYIYPIGNNYIPPDSYVINLFAKQIIY